MTSSPPGFALDGSQQVTTPVVGLDGLRDDIETWLSSHLRHAVRVREFAPPLGNGSSAVTVLMTIEWSDGADVHLRQLVLRLAPKAEGQGLFADYDLAAQHAAMTAVARAGLVPVPAVFAFEESPAALGVPFLIMDRVAGRVPSANPTYAIQGWLVDATPAERRHLQDSTIEAIAQIHATPDPEGHLPSTVDGAGSDALRAHVASQRAYYEWTRRDDRLEIPVIERAFDWIEAHWPARVGTTVLSWGDARIGNVIYQDFEPAAVLDWDMAGLGPRELDLAWFLLSHRVHQGTAEGLGLPGLPDFCRIDDTIEHYQRVSGYEVNDLDFHLVFAALRLSIIRSQLTRRLIGHDEPPTSADDYVGRPAVLSQLLDEFS